LTLSKVLQLLNLSSKSEELNLFNSRESLLNSNSFQFVLKKSQNWANQKLPSIFNQKPSAEQETTNNNEHASYYDEETLAALLEVFADEAREHLQNILKLIQQDYSHENIHELYRAAHTLKGSAATVGLQNISRAALMFEDFFHNHHNRKTLPSAEDTLYILAGLEILSRTIIYREKRFGIIKNLLESAEINQKQQRDNASITAQKSQVDSHNHPFPKRAKEEVKREAKNNDNDEYDNEMDSMQEILMEVFIGEAEEHLANLNEEMEKLAAGQDVTYKLFRITHTLKGSAATVGQDRISKASNLLEDYFENLNEKNVIPSKNSLPFIYHCIDLLSEAINKNVNNLEQMKTNLEKAKAKGFAHYTEKSRKESSKSDSKKITGKKSSLSDPVNQEKQFEQTSLTSKYLRVPVNNINDLVSNSEELVFVRTQIEKSRDEFNSISKDLLLSHHTLKNYVLEDRNQMSEADKLERLQELEVEIAELIYNLEHSTTNLNRECTKLQDVAGSFQNNLINLRITSLKLLFLKLKNTAREIAFQTGRRVDIKLEGEGVELDKGIVDALSTPLIQIVRNCVTHGIEKPELRKAQGKNPAGLIKVQAKQEGNFAIISIKDDGNGIDTEKVKTMLKKRGMLTETGKLKLLSGEELLDAIFLPGFSTKDKATAHSGRGVGLDLVRAKIEKLGGDISVITQYNLGTEFIIKVPLTSFISQALLFKLGNEVYGIPVSYAIETMHYYSVKTLKNGHRILWKDESIPIISLHHYFNLPTNVKNNEIPLIILAHGNKYFAITCDEIVGVKDVTVKPLGEMLMELKYFAGAIVSGAGTIQMIFNISFLANLARPIIGFNVKTQDSKHILTPRILVCDDSKSVREAATRILQNQGYNITKAGDGWEAWNLLHAQDFELLLTDLEMPRLNGYELITEIKRDSFLEDLPVVVLSSRTGEKSRKKANIAGADTFVTKPIKPLILIKTIKKYCPIDEKDMTNRIILFATTNNGKIRELTKLTEDMKLDFWGLDKFDYLPEVIEDGDSFKENAIKKALERATQTGLPSIADDSGLEIDALNGEPGIHSSRYAGNSADDRERNEFILKNMKNARNRKARFVSVIAFCPDPKDNYVITVNGECKGTITHAARGDSGFGYDPIFEISSGQTLAEMTLSEKSKISHRAKAFQKLVPKLREFIEH
ncbi:MAG: RdgB/HAM1 family non-canonical purine NTP pyrophosphatase, partial [Deltaproteobacteria bacterium]|nr:RdgB/HAM1 family non-canonical purine NTP pyrophosphatase [Deltaproteobacteria bacterium]